MTAIHPRLLSPLASVLRGEGLGVRGKLDGETHRGKEDYDRARQTWLEQQGLLVIRCPNEDVYEKIDVLLELIAKHCQERLRGI